MAAHGHQVYLRVAQSLAGACRRGFDLGDVAWRKGFDPIAPGVELQGAQALAAERYQMLG